MHRTIASVVLFAILVVSPAARGELPRPSKPQWKPIADDVYLQEVGRQIPTDHPLLSVAVYRNQAYVGDRDGVSRVREDSLERQAAGPKGEVRKLKTLGGQLWAVAADGLWRLDNERWTKLGGEAASDLCEHLGRIVVAGPAGLFVVEKSGLAPLGKTARRSMRVRGIASYAGTLYLDDGQRVAAMDGGRISAPADWGQLPTGARIRDLLSLGNRMLVATDKGLAVLRGMTWYVIQGADGLCYQDTTCLATGFADDLWIGTSRGAIRNVDQQYQYFGYQRWIPRDKVNATACGDRVAYIATDGGLGTIHYEPYTLAKKAAWYERWLDEWGQKRLGFIHSLSRSGDKWIRNVSDNDVGFSAHYLVGMCFKFAVTGDPAARAEAVDMMKSVKWSEEITGIDGFPARAVWAVGETANKDMLGSAGLPAEWNPTPDGRWEWKGDTSSDELIAQVYETAIFLELVAGPDERKWAVEHLDRIIGHIVREGFVLRDRDGKPTRWGRWDPEYTLSPEGIHERGLNPLETFSFLTTAGHFTKDARYEAARQKALGWGYADYVLRQKVTFPPEWFTHFDDRLAFFAYDPLLNYETDPALRARWLRSLERSWEIKRIEGIPWFNFLYGILTGNECESPRSAAWLRETPLDMRQYSYFNSHRDDLKNVPKGYRMYAERIRPLSPRETALHKWNADFMRADLDSRGLSVGDCGGWIEAYWMGRYFGLITGPMVSDPALVSVPKRGLHVGADPYRGPARPKLRHEQSGS